MFRGVHILYLNVGYSTWSDEEKKKKNDKLWYDKNKSIVENIISEKNLKLQKMIKIMYIWLYYNILYFNVHKNL